MFVEKPQNFLTNGQFFNYSFLIIMYFKKSNTIHLYFASVSVSFPYELVSHPSGSK